MPHGGRHGKGPSRSRQRSQTKRSSQRRQRGRSRAAQRSQSKRDSQRRQQERQRAANVREAARRPVIQKQRQPGLAGSTSAKTMGLEGIANRLEKEFKTASDDRKKQIVDKLKDTRSELNKLNKEQSFLDLRKAAAGLGGKGLVARTTDGTIITDSSGNPIMLTAGREVFDKTRGKFSKEAGRLLEESPELYKRMYPISYGLQKGLPKLMEIAPVIGPIGRIAKATLGKAQDVGSGIMGSKPVQSITSAPGGFFGDLKNMAGDIFGGLGSFLPGGGGRGVYQPTRSVSGRVQEGGDVDRGGVMDAAQSVVDNIYGSRIGVTGPVTGDFRDSDGDGIDDRYQTGPGMKYQGPAMDPFQFKKPANPFDLSFQVAQPVVTQPFEQLNRGTPFNYSVSPLSSQYTQRGIADPNLAQYYQNLNLFPRVV
jgi:ATP-dependent protease HslVU (ClpYQ) peptidase subunit